MFSLAFSIAIALILAPVILAVLALAGLALLWGAIALCWTVLAIPFFPFWLWETVTRKTDKDFPDWFKAELSKPQKKETPAG